MANFLAGMFVTSDRDCCHKNYYVYRDTEGSGEWWMLPWDVDLTYGRNWTGNYFDDRMYYNNSLYIGRGNNVLLSALYAIPEFDAMYRRRTRTVVDRVFQPPDTPPEDLWLEGRIAELHAAVRADAALDQAIWPTWGIPQDLDTGVDELLHGHVARRREWIYGVLAETAQDGPVDILVPGEPGAARGTWRVPLDDDPAWTDPGYDDDAWAEGPLGVGYEDAPGTYAGFIQTPVRPREVDPLAASVQVRIRFDVGNPADHERLVLRARYDDGLVVWLNGVEITRLNVGDDAGWDRGARDHANDLGQLWAPAPLPEDVVDLLVPGQNVLCAQVINVRPESNDLVLLVELANGVQAGGPGQLPPAQSVNAAVTVEGTDDGGERPEEGWIALHNAEAQAVDVSGWHLRGGGAEHLLVPGTVIPAGGTLYVVADSVAFRAREAEPTGGMGLFVQGNWVGRFIDGPVTLIDAQGRDRLR